MMKTKTKPGIRVLFDNIVIKEIDAHLVTHGGIHVPDTYKGHGKSKPKPIRFAEVKHTGAGIKDDHGVLHPPDVKPGDIVFYPDQDKTMREIMLDEAKHFVGTKENFVATLMTEEELAAEEPLLDDFETYGVFGLDGVEPLMNTVWIARDKPKEKTEGGIWLPDYAVDVQYTVDSGEVKLVGQGFWTKYGPLRKMSCKAGMRIVYHKYGGYRTTLPDGTEIWCFRDPDIFGEEDKSTELGFKPIGDRLFVDKKGDEEKIGRIWIPATSKRKDKKNDMGEIVAIGPGAWLDTGERCPMQSEVGTIAVFRRKGGTPIKIDRKELTVLAERDLYFTIAGATGNIDIYEYHQDED